MLYIIVPIPGLNMPPVLAETACNRRNRRALVHVFASKVLSEITEVMDGI